MERRFLATLTAALALGSAAAAGRADGDTANDTIVGRSVDEVTVTARRSAVKISSTMPSMTITRREISDLGIQNVADAVRRFAGADVKDYGGVGGLKTVSVRNMGAAHTGVSYDGAPVSNCQAGQIDIGRFSLDNVARLQLAVGQDDDMLQPARLYASAAVLSIVTTRPEFEDGRRTQAAVKVSGGSFGYVSPTVRWWQRLGRTASASLDANYLHSDGNYPFTLINGTQTTRERRNNSYIDSWHAEANVYAEPDDASDLQVKAYWFWSKRGLPGSVTLYNPVSTETLHDRNAFVQARFRRRFNDRWQMQAIAKYNYGWNKDEERGNQFTGGIYRNVHTQHEGYVSATGLWTPGAGLSLALAQDLALNTLSSTMAECPFPKRLTSLTALSARWRSRRVTAGATLTGTWVTERVRSGSRPADISRLQPAASVSVRPLEGRELFVRAMYKSTFRVPTFNDLYYERLGNRILRPERANEFDLGVTWSGRLFPAMRYVTLSVDGYYNDVSDKIVAFPTTYAWHMVNYGTVHITGVDATLAAAFALGRKVTLSVTGAYTWQRAIDVTDPASKSYRHQLPYTPRHSGNVALTAETPWLTVGYSIVAVGKRYFLSQNIDANRIDGYAEHTLALTRELRLGRVAATLRGEIINLTDKQYDVIKYYPMPGRSWRLTAEIRF